MSVDKEKCKERNLKTRVKKHPIGHMFAHNGQYQCQQLGNLDVHIKDTHSVPQNKECYKCTKCDLTFTAQFQLNITKKPISQNNLNLLLVNIVN